MKYDESEVLNLLRAAHAEPIDAAHYTAVRSRVLAGIERTRSPWRRFAWITGVGALAAAIILSIVLRNPDVAPPPRIVAAIPQAPSAPAVPIARAALRPPHREPLTIKIQTEDPNIVIYWIAD